MKTVETVGRAVVVAIVALGASVGRADVLAPLRSTDLDLEMTAAGFDEWQRKAVLSAHEAYATQFGVAVAGPMKAWLVVAQSTPPTLAEGHAAQRAGKAAADAFLEAEQPIAHAIRRAERRGQEVAVARLLAELAIRRDLAFIAASGSARAPFGPTSVWDFEAAVEKLGLPPSTRAGVSEATSNYLAERAAVVHALRDATINAPLRRVEAQAKFPCAVREGVIGGPGWVAPSPDEAMAQLQARRDAEANRTAFASVEVNTARRKACALDIRTIDSVIPALSAPNQMRLVVSWWSGTGLQLPGIGMMQLTAHLTMHSFHAGHGSAAATDGACAAFMDAWWGKAKAVARDTSGVVAMARDESDQRHAELDAIAMTAVEALKEAFEMQSDASPPPERLATDEDAFPPEPPPMLNLSDPGVVARQVVAFNMDTDGEPSDNTVTLPRPLSFEQLQAVFEASGVSEGSLGAVKTVFADLNAEAAPLVEEARAFDLANSTSLDGQVRFPSGSATSITQISDDERIRTAAQRRVIRERLLALEQLKLDEIVRSFVPETGQAIVQWIALWRSTRHLQYDAREDWTWAGNERSLDPALAVLSAELTAAQWSAIASDYNTAWRDIAAKTRAGARAWGNAREKDSRISQGGSSEDLSSPAVSHEAFADADAAMEVARRAAEALHNSQLALIASVKAHLSVDAATRVQDAWDDQRCAGDLADQTSLSTRFAAVLAMDLPDAVKTAVRDGETKWSASWRGIRNRIVVASTALGVEKLERQSAIKALRFEREECDLAAFRDLISALPADAAARIPPLPVGTRRGGP